MEPFKSNKEKFNFWYIEETSPHDSCSYFNNPDFDTTLRASCSDNVFLSSNCPYSNKFVTHVINHQFRSHSGVEISQSISLLDADVLFQSWIPCDFEQYCQNADLDHNGCVDNLDIEIFETFVGESKLEELEYNPNFDFDSDDVLDVEDSLIFRDCSRLSSGCQDEQDCFNVFSPYTGIIGDSVYLEKGGISTFVHEFGHQYGDLIDEYVEGLTIYKSVTDRRNCYSEGLATTRENCEQNVKWNNLYGNGCGEDGVVDCCTNNELKIADGGLRCIEGEENENFNLEIGCFEGCSKYSQKIFRSAFNTIMRYHGGDPYSYGKWNEQLIQQKLDDYTGEII